MKKQLPSLVLVFVLLFLSCVTAPAEEISLAQALEMFYRSNYDIIINRYEIDKSYGDYIAARLIPNPVLSINFSGMGNPTLSQNLNNQETYRLDQLIELGGKRGYRIRSATEALEATRLSHRDAIRNLLVGFYTNYYNLILSALNIDFAVDELKRFDRVLTIGEKRFNAGFLTLIDYTKLKLTRIDMENNLTNLSNQYKNDLETFNLLLGGTSGYAPAKTEISDVFPQYSEGPLLDAAYAHRYDLLSLERQVKSAEESQKLAKAQRIPDITVGAEYERYRSPVESGIGAGISLNIPLFYRNRGEILRRTAEYNQFRVQLEKTKRQIQTDVRQALNNYGASLTVFDAYRSRKTEMQELLGRSDKAFSLGGITVLELIDTTRTYRDFMTRYNQALIQSALNQELLKVSTGEIK